MLNNNTFDLKRSVKDTIVSSNPVNIEVENAKRWIMYFLNTDSSIMDQKIVIPHVDLITCKTFDHVIATTMIHLDKKYQNMIIDKYHEMIQRAWVAISSKYNIKKNEYINQCLDKYKKVVYFEHSDELDFLYLYEIVSSTQESIISNLINMFYRSGDRTLSSAIRQYYKKKYNIAKAILMYPNQNYLGVNVIHIRNNEFVLTTVLEKESSVLGIRNLFEYLDNPDKNSILKLVTHINPNLNKKCVSNKYSKIVSNTMYTCRDPFQILVNERVVKDSSLLTDKQKQERQIRIERQYENKLLSNQLVIYVKGNTVYSINSNRAIVSTNYKYLDSTTLIRMEENGLNTLIENNLFDTYDGIHINTTILKKAIVEVISNTSDLNDITINKFTDKLKNVINAMMKNKQLSDCFDIFYIANNIDVIPAYDFASDTFYKKSKAFDYITIDLSASTYGKIPVTMEEGVRILKENQAYIANMALDKLMESKRVTKYNVPRNMFRLDDMVYIKSENYIRLWFGIKGVK